MSFSFIHVSIDGSLRNPFVAVAMSILIVLSIATAYRFVLVVLSRRWRSIVTWGAGLAAIILLSDWLLHLVTGLVFNVYHMDRAGVSLLGEHPAWLIPWAAPLGGLLAVLRSRRRVHSASNT